MPALAVIDFCCMVQAAASFYLTVCICVDNGVNIRLLDDSFKLTHLTPVNLCRLWTPKCQVLSELLSCILLNPEVEHFANPDTNMIERMSLRVLIFQRYAVLIY